MEGADLVVTALGLDREDGRDGTPQPGTSAATTQGSQDWAVRDATKIARLRDTTGNTHAVDLGTASRPKPSRQIEACLKPSHDTFAGRTGAVNPLTAARWRADSIRSTGVGWLKKRR